MKKVTTALVVALASVVIALGFAVPAHAYPDDTPSVSPPQVNSTSVDSNEASDTLSEDASALPSTGGPNAWLITGGAALLLVGGGAVVMARRRETATD